MLKIFTNRNLLLRLLLGLLCATLLVSCQSDEQALEQDAPATAVIKRVIKGLSEGKKISQEDVDALKKVADQYPDATPAREALLAALIDRRDWGDLEKLYLTKKASAELTDEDKINLGKVYIKLGRYAEAVETLAPLQPAGNLETTSLLANAYFQLGRYDESKQLLDGAWEKILAEKRADDIVARGLIYFYQGETDPAIATLEKALEIDPDRISASNGLSRIYAARGEPEKAAEYLDKLQKTFDKITADEKTKTKLVGQLYRLQEAYQAKRFQEVITIAEQALPQTDVRNQKILYQYLFNSYQALGKSKEAQEVLARAQQLQKQ